MDGSVTCKTLFVNGLALLAALVAHTAYAHGGVYLEEDVCVLQVSYFKAHFTVFQPQTRRYTEYCEDLPDVTESVFVLEYSHPGLGKTPLTFRIIRDVTGKGRFARWSDIAAIEDIEGATVFFEPSAEQPDAFMVVHEFDQAGSYIGIVTAVEPTSGETIRAVFPFEVGFGVGLGYWPLLIVALLFIQLNYWWMRRARLRSGLASMVVAALLVAPLATGWAQDPDNETGENQASLRVTFRSQQGEFPVNQMHSWILHIESQAGESIVGAEIVVDGGMPAHDHGLQTRPQVTRYLGDGDYLLEGMKFHMAGAWEVNVTVVAAEVTHVVTLKLAL
jgi:hypothetical protein